MKPQSLIQQLLVLSIGAVSCTAPEEGTGSVTLEIVPPAPLSRSESLPDGSDQWEEEAADCQVFIFDGSGTLEMRDAPGTESSLTYNLTTGMKDIHVVSGCPELYPRDIRELESVILELGNTRGKSLPMTGHLPVAVARDEPASHTVALKRCVSRITITAMRNSLLSGLDIETSFVFLRAGRTRIDLPLTGMVPDSGLQNTDYGQFTDFPDCVATSDLVGARTGAIPCGKGSSSVPASLYTFPGAGLEEADFPSLVVATGVRGEWFFGEIPLGELRANTAYTVEVDIRDTGPALTGDLCADGFVTGWKSGASYTENM